MDRVLVVSVLLWSSALQIEDGGIFIEHVMLSGPNGCNVTLEVFYTRNVDLNYTQTLCRDRDCGSVVRTSSDLWRNLPTCFGSDDRWKVCDSKERTRLTAANRLNIFCSDSVRLVDGTSLCSGRLEVKSAQSDQRWSSVCEADFDQQDAEVVCRELGCGAPSVLQGALYGEVESPTWTKEFQCGGNESALLDCRSSGSTRNTCSPGKAVGLTCSEPVRLVGGDSRCAGTLEVKYRGEWRPVGDYHGPESFLYSDWTLKAAAAVCRDLDCGSAVSLRRREDLSSDRSVWMIWPPCVHSGSALKDCVASRSSPLYLDLTCSDLLVQPNISVSSSMNGVSEVQQQGLRVLRGSTFTISCSIQPQYPGGSFQLTFTSSTTAHNYTQPAVNHSAHFLFPAAEPAHTGSYSCVYHVYVSSHKFSSGSRRLSVTVSDPTVHIIRWVVVPLTLLLVIAAIYFCYKASRGQKPGRQENIELVDMNLDAGAAEGGRTEEEGAQGAE